LKFGERAKKLKIKAKKNVRLSYEEQDKLIKKLQKENEELKKNLSGGKSPEKFRSLSQHDESQS